jgi:hypothetical protein
MTKSEIRQLTFEEFNNRNIVNLGSYEDLFLIINICEDTNVSEKARPLLYKLIAFDFLNNYTNNDFFDKDRNQSIDLFEGFLKYLDGEEVKNALLEHLKKDSSREVAGRLWDIFMDLEPSIDQLLRLVIYSGNLEVRMKAWELLTIELEYEMKNEKSNPEEIQSTLLEIFNKTTDVKLESDCWNVLWEFNLFDSDYPELVTDSPFPKVAEYAWRRMEVEKLHVEDLMRIIKMTASNSVAEQALKLYRNNLL